MSKKAIDGLNNQATNHIAEGMSATAALWRAATDAGLAVIRESDDAIVYMSPWGHIVNCWLEGTVSQSTEEGGAGFDDQVEWAEEALR